MKASENEINKLNEEIISRLLIQKQRMKKEIAYLRDLLTKETQTKNALLIERGADAKACMAHFIENRKAIQ